MRILLVDGDETLLQRLRQVFWRRHRGWEVLLASTGAQALDALARDAVDIVIAEVELADMAGLDLLRRVREMQPGAVRIALGDQATPAWLEEDEGDLHRLFTKPVEAEFLIGVVESLDIEDDAANVRAVRAFVGGLRQVPSLPSLYAELVELLHRDEAGMGEVARLMRRDLGMASQVLKLANSGQFGSNRAVVDIGQAVAMLGVDSLKSLVLFRGLISSFESPSPQGLDLEQLWFHSFQVAMGVRKLAALEGETHLTDLAFSVGLLHDIGLVVLATDPVGRYEGILQQAQASRIPLAVLEHDTYGVDHAQIGAHLLNLWGLPPAFCRPVREHHAPPAAGEGFPLSLALHLSDARHGGGTTAGIFADGRWGLHPHALADSARFERWKACLAMDVSESGSYA